jgi:hypothetical protein
VRQLRLGLKYARIGSVTFVTTPGVPSSGVIFRGNMLDSKAVASVKLGIDGKWAIYVRANYVENLGIYSFFKHQKRFDTELKASLEFKKLYPLGILVPFDQLPIA